LVEVAPSETTAGDATPDFEAGWAAIRDANIRPYVEWVVPPPFALPVATTARGGEAKPAQSGQNQSGRAGMIRAAVAGGTGIPGTDAAAILVTGATGADRVCRACTTPAATSSRKTSCFTQREQRTRSRTRKKKGLALSRPTPDLLFRPLRSPCSL